MQKVLLVDTNFSAVPIYDYLVDSRYEVFVCGSNPFDFLARTTSNYINLDYSDITKVNSLIDVLGIDYIVPGCNDCSYQVCAVLNTDGRYPGLDSIAVSEILNNKRKFREFATQIGIPVPRVISEQTIGDVWPLIVKPVDAYSGRGVTVVNQSEKDNLSAAIDQARQYSRSQMYLIEEYVDGQLYSHSAFIDNNGEIQQDFIVEEHCSANPFVVDTSYVVNDFSGQLLQRIREDVQHMAKHLILVAGLIHTQFILKDGKYWFIEVTRRCPGDLYAQMIQYSTGFRYAEAYSAHFIGRGFAGVQKMHLDYILRHTVSQPENGVFRSIQFNTKLQIQKFLPCCLAGDSVKASPFGRIGLLFARTESYEELISLMQLAIERKLYMLH